MPETLLEVGEVGPRCCRQALHGEWPEGLPRGYDFWLFDDTDIWAMEYDSDGEFVAAEQVTDPSLLEQHRQWRDRALALATPLADYAATIPS